MREGRIFCPLFFIGLFAQTHVQLVGSIGISELFMFLSAPIFFFQDAVQLRKDGFMTFLWLAILACASCVVSSIYNHTPFPMAVRGFASTYSLFAIPVVIHHYLRRDLSSWKWFYVGVVISALITVFGFRTSVEDSMEYRLAGGIEESELYYLRHFWGIAALPLKCCYIQLPTLFAAGLLALPTVFTVATTSTGRSMVLALVSSLFMLLFVGRKYSMMRRLQKSFIVLAAVGLFSAVLVASGYKYAAMHGYLNERSQEKYEKQTKSGTGVKALIMSGRGEFFTGLYCCLQRPFMGFGPWAVDRYGYNREFVLKYGDEEAIASLCEREAIVARKGGFLMLPAHSILIQFWLWFGLLAVPICLYMLYKIYEYMTKYLTAVPQWFGCLALETPTMVWTIWFSPYAERVVFNAFLTFVLMAIAIGKDSRILSSGMRFEIERFKRGGR